MVDWIEKEVEASILEIDPCFIDPLKRLSRILNFEQLSFSRRYGAVCIMYIATGSFKDWKCHDRCRTWSYKFTWPSIKCDIKI